MGLQPGTLVLEHERSTSRPLSLSRRQAIACETEGPGFESPRLGRRVALVSSHVLGPIGRPVIAAFQWRSHIDHCMNSIQLNNVHKHKLQMIMWSLVTSLEREFSELCCGEKPLPVGLDRVGCEALTDRTQWKMVARHGGFVEVRH